MDCVTYVSIFSLNVELSHSAAGWVQQPFDEMRKSAPFNIVLGALRGANVNGCAMWAPNVIKGGRPSSHYFSGGALRAPPRGGAPRAAGVAGASFTPLITSSSNLTHHTKSLHRPGVVHKCNKSYSK